MKTVIMVAALAATGEVTPKMDGARLRAGSTCYAIVAGDKTIGSTLQTVTASRDKARPVAGWLRSALGRAHIVVDWYAENALALTSEGSR